tara:strand:- start:318 stop:1016 length:699 start_codon:yes stop_codon:yes gene_type:complete
MNNLLVTTEMTYIFDPSDHAIKEAIEKIFQTEDLSKIHETPMGSWTSLANPRKSEYKLLDDPVTCNDTDHHKTFYEGIKQNSEFNDAYVKFIKNEIRPKLDEKFFYQRVPSFRVHLPNNLAVGAFHKDKEYSHSQDEINIYLPITEAYKTNTIWVESEEDKQDMHPLEARYGEYYIWNGANLLHGNKVNETEKTRVSIDFRILRMKDYRLEEATKTSISQGTKMMVGEYWAI